MKDRRRFSESGDVRESDATAPPETEAPKPSEPKPASPPEPAATAGPAGPAEPVTFSTFVLGLSTQALLHLGEIPNPVTRTLETDLDAARQVIDILGMLAEKTRNNLEPGEQSLLESALYDLRMRYVELRRAGAKEKR